MRVLLYTDGVKWNAECLEHAELGNGGDSANEAALYFLIALSAHCLLADVQNETGVEPGEKAFAQVALLQPPDAEMLVRLERGWTRGEPYEPIVVELDEIPTGYDVEFRVDPLMASRVEGS